MFEFKKLCDEYEKLSTVEKGLLLADSSVTIMAKLHNLDVNGIDPIQTLAGFIIGSVVADGKVSEKECVLIYPALVKAFGNDFDFNSVKESFKKDHDGRKRLSDYTEDMIRVLDFLDDEIKSEIVTLCLCVMAIDGKISLKEKNYIKRLCKA